MSNVDRPVTVKSEALDGTQDGVNQTETMGENGGSGDDLHKNDDFVYLEYFDDFK